jgi:hypothetical protein
MTDTQAVGGQVTGPQQTAGARPGMMTGPRPVPIGMAVGQAEAVLGKLLARVLAETGTSRQHYLAMQRLAGLGGAATREAYVFDLSDALGIDLWAAGELADTLAEAGLLAEADGVIQLGEHGADVRGRIAGSAGAITRALLAPISPADVETTIRTLREVTLRGRALLAAGNGDVTAA